jgi:hypothetical protein
MSRLALVAAVALLLLGGAAQGARRTAPSNTSPPTISGTPIVGSVLTASNGAWAGSTPMSFTYRWQRCNASGGKCDGIKGARNPTYRLEPGDAGHTIRVSVTATNADGSANSVSGQTAVISSGAPVNTALPTIAGAVTQGTTVTATSGTWSGPGPINFGYTWRRCDTGGGHCRDIQSGPAHQIGTEDLGHTLRIAVRARNQNGSTIAVSAQTGVVAPRGPIPAATALPVITGVPREGQMLSASIGAWSNAPSSFAYTWRRCDASGTKCDGFATGSAVRLTDNDVGHRIRVVVSATNQFGTAKATSAPTAAVVKADATPEGAIKLPSGETSLPVSVIVSPQRLVISGVQFIPSRVVGRQAFTGRFRVTDTRGFVVRGALVYAVGLPYGWIRVAPEVVTGTDGWAQITFLPTANMPISHAALVFFLRARKQGDSLLAGVSSRRLVQVRIG